MSRSIIRLGALALTRIRTAVALIVKGALRREVVRDLGVEQVDPLTRAESLSKQERAEVSAIHPLLMGGEFLPDLESGEVEIARIEIGSTTADIWSLRARWESSAIRYRLVDEYESLHALPIRSSLKESLNNRPFSRADNLGIG